MAGILTRKGSSRDLTKDLALALAGLLTLIGISLFNGDVDRSDPPGGQMPTNTYSQQEDLSGVNDLPPQRAERAEATSLD